MSRNMLACPLTARSHRTHQRARIHAHDTLGYTLRTASDVRRWLHVRAAEIEGLEGDWPSCHGVTGGVTRGRTHGVCHGTLIDTIRDGTARNVSVINGGGVLADAAPTTTEWSGPALPSNRARASSNRRALLGGRGASGRGKPEVMVNLGTGLFAPPTLAPTGLEPVVMRDLDRRGEGATFTVAGHPTPTIHAGGGALSTRSSEQRVIRTGGGS